MPTIEDVRDDAVGDAHVAHRGFSDPDDGVVPDAFLASSHTHHAGQMTDAVRQLMVTGTTREVHVQKLGGLTGANH